MAIFMLSFMSDHFCFQRRLFDSKDKKNTCLLFLLRPLTAEITRCVFNLSCWIYFNLFFLFYFLQFNTFEAPKNLMSFHL